MTTFGLASAKGSPGVTTTAVGLTLVWPRPVLLVEADPAGGDLLAGYLAGADASGGGLLSLALAARRGALGPQTVMEHALPLDPDGDRRVLVAPADHAQSRPITEVIAQLIGAVTNLCEFDERRDVILDLGRVGSATSTWLALPSEMLLLLAPTLRGASAARSAQAMLRNRIGDECRISAVLAGQGPYSATEIAEALEVPVAGSVVHDPASARVLCGEAPTPRAFDRSPLIRSLRSLSNEITRAEGLPGSQHGRQAQRDTAAVGGSS